MAALGLLMGGKIYSFQTENPLTILAFFSDLGIGALYFLSKIIPIGLGDIKVVTFEFLAYIVGIVATIPGGVIFALRREDHFKPKSPETIQHTPQTGGMYNE